MRSTLCLLLLLSGAALRAQSSTPPPTSPVQKTNSSSNLTAGFNIATGATVAVNTGGALNLTGGGTVTYPAALEAIKALVPAADKMVYYTGVGSATIADITGFGRSLLDDADATAGRVTLGVRIGTDVEAHDATLTALAGVATLADKLIYATGVDTFTTTNLTSHGRTLIGLSAGTTAQYLRGDGSYQTLNQAAVAGLATTDAVVHASVKAAGAGGAGFLEGVNQSSAPSTPTTAGRIFWDSSNRFSWKGTNGFVRTFDGTANSQDRVYALPNADGTVLLNTNPANTTVTNLDSISPTSGTAFSIVSSLASDAAKVQNNNIAGYSDWAFFNNAGSLVAAMGWGNGSASTSPGAAFVYSSAGYNVYTGGSTGTAAWAINNSGNGTLLGDLTITGGDIVANTVTGASGQNLTATGGSSGASLVLGQGTNGGALFTPNGSGVFRAASTVRVENVTAPTSGAGLEIQYGSNIGTLFCYDRTGAVYKALNYYGLQHQWFIGASEAARLSPTNGNLLVGGTTEIPGTALIKSFGTTDATNTTSGNQFAGGVGIAKALFVGTTGNFGGNVNGTNVVMSGQVGGGNGSAGSPTFSNGGFNSGLYFVANNPRLSAAGGVYAVEFGPTTTDVQGDLTVSGGNVGVGTAPVTNNAILVQGSVLSGATSQVGVASYATHSSGATSNARAYAGAVYTANASYTVTTGSVYYADTPSLLGSSAVTNLAGVLVKNQGTTGVANACGIDIEAQSGAATANVGLRNAGTTILGSSGSAISTVKTATATLDFPSKLAGEVADLTITLTGAALNDTVALGVPNGSVTATAEYFAWVSASNTITVRFSPKATEDPASGTFRATLVQF